MKPPDLETEERTFEAVRFFRATWALTTVITLFLVLLIAVQPETAVRRSITVFIIWLLGLALLRVNYAGRTRLAGWTLVLGLTALLTQRTYTSGGIAASATALYAVIVMLAGLLLGETGGAVVAAVCVGIAYWLMTVTASGVLPPPEMHYTHFTMMLYVVMAIFWTLTVQQLVAWSLKSMLGQAKKEADDRYQAQLRLRLALDAGDLGVWDWNPSTSKITADRRTFNLHGLPYTDGEQIPLEKMLEPIHPDDRERIKMAILGVGKERNELKCEFRTIHPDGGIRHLECAGTEKRNSSGSPPRIVGIHRDVTGEKIAEQQKAVLLHSLQERIKELQLLHQAARLFQRGNPSLELLFRELVTLMTAAWQYPECCEARIVYDGLDMRTPGWQDSEWKQETAFRTATGDGRMAVVYTQRRPPADEGPFLKEERTLLDSLSELLVSYLNLRAHQQDLELLVKIRTSELSANLEQLKKLEQLRDDLVKMIVHDMRSPLTVMLGYLQLLKPNVRGDDAALLSQAVIGAETLRRMANTLLDVSRLEAGQMPIEWAPCNVAALVESVRASMLAMEPDRPISFNPPGPVQIHCDSGLVRRIVENLVSNGIKHTPSGEPLLIELQKSPDRVRISVQDRGTGVPPELRHRIFEKFGTVTTRQDKKYHSTGLGLAFCKLAVEAHGGSIGVESVLPKGSEFWLELPLSGPAADKTTSASKG